MADVPRESDVLVPFEIANIPTEYRDYYGMKRQNMFATIQKHPAFWTYFHMLDQIMYREIKDLEVSTDPTNHLPRIFFINAHAKVRIAIELAFQGCIQECRSILRDAVEWAAFGHYLNSDPALQTIWWEQHQPAGKSVYKAQFVDNKRLTLFAGQDELYQKFRQLSDAGSHPTPMSLSGRLFSGHSLTICRTPRSPRPVFNSIASTTITPADLARFPRVRTCAPLPATPTSHCCYRSNTMIPKTRRRRRPQSSTSAHFNGTRLSTAWTPLPRRLRFP